MLKLIRDKYVNEIDPGRLTKIEPSSEEYRQFLYEKLYEELNELELSDWKDVNEYADVYEVFMTIMNVNNITEERVMSAKMSKRCLLGGFDDGIVLVY